MSAALSCKGWKEAIAAYFVRMMFLSSKKPSRFPRHKKRVESSVPSNLREEVGKVSTMEKTFKAAELREAIGENYPTSSYSAVAMSILDEKCSSVFTCSQLRRAKLGPVQRRTSGEGKRRFHL